MSDYEEGQNAAWQYHNLPAFASFSRDVDGSEAIKLFKPPVNESMVMVSTPIPKNRADWIKGFNDWKKENMT